MQPLSEEDYAILVEEFRKGGQELTQTSIEQEAAIKAEFEAAGVTFHDADVAAYREATSGFWSAWPEGFYDQLRAAAE